MANELKTFEAGRFAIARSDAAVAQIVSAIKDNGVKYSDLPKLLIPGKGVSFFQIDTPSGRATFEKLEVVIALVIGNQKAWWAEDAADGAAGRIPNCASTDGLIGRGNNRPDQHPDGAKDSHDCLTCAWNRFESDRKGGRGKDCKDFALLFCFAGDNRLPMVLNVPPSSLKPMRGYMMQKLLNVGLDPWGCVTRLSLHPEKDGSKEWNSLVFELAAPLSGEEVDRFGRIRAIIDASMRRQAPTITAGDYVSSDARAAAEREGAAKKGAGPAGASPSDAFGRDIADAPASGEPPEPGSAG